MPKARFRGIAANMPPNKLPAGKRHHRHGRVGRLGQPTWPWLKPKPLRIAVCSAKSTNPAISYRGSKPIQFAWLRLFIGQIAEYKDKVSPAIDGYPRRQSLRRRCIPVWQASRAAFASHPTTTSCYVVGVPVVSVFADVVYQLIDTPKGKLVRRKIGRRRAQTLRFSDGIAILPKPLPDKLENLHMNHPFLELDIPMLIGDRVTTDAHSVLAYCACSWFEDYCPQ